jgi:predicted DNA-binding protein with PD1-like motif
MAPIPPPLLHHSASAELLNLRLLPGADLRAALEQLVIERCLAAAWVTAAIGSLEALVIRPAGQAEALRLDGPWEVLSLQGSLGPAGGHLHVSAADAAGHCRGGHLLPGNRIRTTAEIALLLPAGVRFGRTPDPATGCRELSFGATAGPIPGAAPLATFYAGMSP